MATPANKLSVRSNAGKGSAKSPKSVVERVACSVVEHATRSVPPTIALTTPFIKPEAPNGARAGRRRRGYLRALRDAGRITLVAFLYENTNRRIMRRALPSRITFKSSQG